MNYILIPELQYYFGNFLNERMIKNEYVLTPVLPKSAEIYSGSIIELLLSETFDSTSYSYLLREIGNKMDWPRTLYQRATVISQSRCFVFDSTGTLDILNLTNDDFMMLNILFGYRSSGIGDISWITYENLSTILSKLVYSYLDMKLNSSITNFNNITILSSSTSLIENLFEIYICDEIFKFTEQRNIQ